MIVALIGLCTSAAAVVGRFPKWKTVMRIFENHCVVSLNYRRVSNTRRILVGNKIVDHSGCSWSIACRRCSNYIFILDITSGLKGFGIDGRKRVR